MAAAIKPEYTIFYVAGREADVLDDDDLDVVEIADEILAGKDLRETLVTLGATLAAPLAHVERKEWILDNREAIDEAGGDADEAWRCYQQGRIDQYAHELEADVVEAMIGEDEEDDEDDDDEEDDIDDGDGEDEDDDKIPKATGRTRRSS